MQLKPGSYLILGMVARGVTTGYAIKRIVDRSTRFFWAASFAQVYPELAALEENGYLTGHDESHGARRRKVYDLTPQGRSALTDWMRSDRSPSLEFRDEGLLRLFFADALPPDDSVELVGRLRAEAEVNLEIFREQILPLAEGAVGRFPLIVAREGADYFAWRAEWFRAIEAELAGENGDAPS